MNLSKKEQELFDELHNERQQDAKTFNKPSYKGIWAGIIDKYKEKAHFVYELLQNADDAQASIVTFQLEDDQLVFRHNGKIGFTVSSENSTEDKGHINALTGVGNSTKNEIEGNTIGKFGVGFKAVFQYTKEPRIYDDKFWFKIEQFIVPTALKSDFKGRKNGETVFVFPFHSPETAYKEIIERLQTLNNPILFLRHLTEVRIIVPNHKNIVYSKSSCYLKKHDDITHELLSITNNGKMQKLHLFTRNINVTDNNGDKTFFISVGYFLKGNGDLDDTTEQKVFCFFPTAESFKLKCVVHAPFLLVDSRQQLKDDNLNNQLKELLAELASEALPLLRDYGINNKRLLITENIFNIIPRYDNWYEPDDVFRDAYIEKLKTKKLLLARSSKYILSEEALICHPLSLMNIINDKQLLDLKKGEDDDITNKWYFLREETQKICSQSYVKDILNKLDVEEYDGKSFASDITSSFMEAQGFKWAKRLYTHLRNEQIGLYKRPENSKKTIDETPFCLSPIILTSNNEWIPAYTKSGKLNVFLPLATEAKGYNFISLDYDKDCLAFVKEMGLKQPDAWDYIQSVLLQKYDNEEEFDDDDLRDDFELIYGYINGISDKKTKIEKVSEISRRLGLVTTQDIVVTIDAVYDNTDILQKYFNKEKRKFVNYVFYKSFIDKHSVQEFRDFIHLLGVAESPRVIPFERNWFKPAEKQKYDIKYTWCVISDCKLDGFDEWSPKDIEVAKAVWSWMSNLKNYTEIDCKYQYYSIYHMSLTSTMFNSFSDKEWIITSKGEVLKPTEVSIEELEDAEYQIDYDLNRYFGIEKKVKSLKELGASDSQIEQEKLGKLANKLGLDTPEKLQEAYDAVLEKKQKKSVASKQQNNPFGNASNINSGFLHGEQRKTSLKDMASSNKKYSDKTNDSAKSLDERVGDLTQKLSDEAKKRLEEENKRASIPEIPKYTKKWFVDLLDLEYLGTNSSVNFSKKAIKITFDRFRKEQGTNSIYLLTNPSRNIPIWLEEIGDLTVKFNFFNRDDITLSFEVANVKDFTLRVKAKNADIAQIDIIDWSKCTKAIVEVNNPVEIIGKLKTAFNALKYDDDYDFKKNLSKNIRFVFGPPGTGKTTRLAEIISQKMQRESKILVLTPTNKACDVLCNKLIENQKNDYSWLGRFVATGDKDVESSGILIDRDSDLWQQKRFCVVSTIARLPYDGFIFNGKNRYLKDINWDFVIIDEASMIPLVQIVYAIYKMNTSIFIIAGDPMQIAPIVKEQAWIGENIYTMVNLNNFENPTTEPIQFDVEKLNTQYRSIPTIGNLYSNYSYDGKLKHHRTNNQILSLEFGSIKAKPITLIPFRVERFDSIFGAKKLQGSNVHIYSALLTVEMTAYISKQQKQSVRIRIGVICPYAPQAQLINKMIEQRTDIPENVDILVGTIHGFQGDQCDIIVSVFNPPTGIKVAADRILLNNKNIINVAISRASDYLFILLPHSDSYGYENLIEINNLCSILDKDSNSVSILNSEEIEKSIWNDFQYIESNTFVTTHQTANVYTTASNFYEVRIDDNAIDIQLSSDRYIRNLETDSESNSLNYNYIDKENENELINPVKKTFSNHEQLYQNTSANLEESKYYSSAEEYYSLFEQAKLDIMDAVNILVSSTSMCALFTLFQILGNKNIRERFGWMNIDNAKVKSIRKNGKLPHWNNIVYPWIFNIIKNGICPFKGHAKSISELDLDTFTTEFDSQMNRLQNKVKKKKIKASSRLSYSKYKPHTETKKSTLYEDFEYGLSDW